MGLREAKPSGILPFRVGMDEYRSFLDETARNGVHSITVIGSSRAREAVLPLSMRRAITAEFGCTPTTANHALPGAHAMEAELAVRRMLESPRPPRLVLYGLGPRQLLAKPRPWVNASYLWSPSEWLAARREHGPAVDPYVGRVLRTWAGQRSWLLRYRPLISRIAHLDKADLRDGKTWAWTVRRQWEARRRVDIDPKLTGLTYWHREAPDQVRAVSDERVRLYLSKVLGEEQEYTLQAEQIEHARVSIEALQDAGVSVVLFAVPMSQVLVRNLPPGVMDDFDRTMRDLSASTGAPWLDERTLGGPLPQAMFREQSHVNLPGAKQWTASLVENLPPDVMTHAIPECGTSVRKAR